MGRATLIRFITGPWPAIVLSVVLLVSVFLLSESAQHSDVLGGFYSTLLLINVVGMGALFLLILGNLVRLVRQFRARVLGSRITLRLLGMFVLLAVIPLAVVYYFSTQFLNKGIDSWFDVRIEQALDDALLLGRTSLEAIKQDRVREVEDMTSEVADVTTDAALIQVLDDLREQGGFVEITLLSQDGRVIAWSSADPSALIPDRPSEAVLSKLRQGAVYANLEPLGNAGLQLRIVVPVYPRDVKRPLRLLQVLQPLPLRYSKLGESVQSAFTEYEKLVYLHDALKFSFILTLTLVTLMTLLIAVWASIFSARRLAAPLRELAEGTRAVAAGDYRKQLPVSSNDEFGILVRSFNDMTRQISHAQTEARRSQREAETQRTYLETVLAHLSSGVLSFDLQHRLLTQNATASQILGIEAHASQGQELRELVAHNTRLEPLFQAIADAIQNDVSEWQCEVTIFGTRGRQVLMCRGSQLPGQRGRKSGGYVVVFDDITTLIQAQRDAAWGEVARRLAHEIKNPLTPIQLSTERIRHKYLGKLAGRERDTLDRATRTIAEQVESMKTMVNAFASYAQPKQIQPETMDLNQLVQDVVELHKDKDSPVKLRVSLDHEMPAIMADRGRLRQVLNNLVINARAALAGAEQPEIEVATRCLPDGEVGHAEICVRDNGPGFPKELMDRIFEPYVTTKEKGNGLGLAIVKRIVEEHGGTLWAENLPNGGASVTIHLPVEGAARRENTITTIKNAKEGIA